MAIATFGVVAADIERRLKPYVFDASSNPTSTDIDSYIVKEIASEVNGVLQGLGMTPSEIDDTNEPISYQYIRGLIADGSAARTLRAMSVRDPERAQQLARDYRDGLNRILAHPEILSDYHTKTQGPGTWRSYLDDTTINDGSGVDTDTDYQPMFRVDARNRKEF